MIKHDYSKVAGLASTHTRHEIKRRLNIPYGALTRYMKKNEIKCVEHLRSSHNYKRAASLISTHTLQEICEIENIPESTLSHWFSMNGYVPKGKLELIYDSFDIKKISKKSTLQEASELTGIGRIYLNKLAKRDGISFKKNIAKTKYDYSKIKDMANEGLTLKELSEKSNIPYDTLYTHVVNKGVEVKNIHKK